MDKGRALSTAPHHRARHCPLPGVDFLGSPCVRSSVSGIRTSTSPFSPLWEKGAGGTRGKSARELGTQTTMDKRMIQRGSQDVLALTNHQSHGGRLVRRRTDGTPTGVRDTDESHRDQQSRTDGNPAGIHDSAALAELNERQPCPPTTIILLTCRSPAFIVHG